MMNGPIVAATDPLVRRDSNLDDSHRPDYITRKLKMTNTDPSVIFCDECWEPITDETFYIFGFGKGHALSDEIICENCLRLNHMRYTVDFIQERKDMDYYGEV